MTPFKFVRIATAVSMLGVITTLVFPTVAPLSIAIAAVTPPKSGEVFDFSKADADLFKTENTTVSVIDEAGAKVVKAEFPAGNGYPSFDFPTEDGGWNLSAFGGVQIDITNTSASAANIALRVDNAGDWKKNPFNTESVWVGAGQTKTLKVTFGKSYGGGAGFALDSSKVSAIKVFAINPKTATTITVKNLKGFGTPSAAAPAAATAPATTTQQPTVVAGGNQPPATGILFDALKADENSITNEGATGSLVKEDGGALKMEYPASGYPAVVLPVPSGGWNLSAFGAVQAEITNTGTTGVSISLRVDNAGDWKKQPWNTEAVSIGAGQTKTVKVVFGKSYGGNAGYALDSSKVSAIKLFANTPKQGGTVLIKNIKAVVTPKAIVSAAPAANTNTATASTANLKAPAISGELLDLTKAPVIETQESNASIETNNGAQAIKAVFQAGANYPNVKFPVPAGGWNLSAFGGVQVEVTNPGTTAVTANLRIDNPGDWKQSPWNTESLKIAAGETKTVKLTFGMQNGAPGYPLKSDRISAMQLFLIKPKQDTTLFIKDLKAFGSPGADASNLSLTLPEDRNKQVIPPAWVGTRPPVEGNWVQTLNENFDGTELNSKYWMPRDPQDNPLPGQNQRYSFNNVKVENGLLKIKTEKLFGHNYDDPKNPTKEYTTGMVSSFGKFTQAYGYFEARIKVPTARGLWPAFWMMPDRGEAAGIWWKRQATENGGMEFDILEHLTEWGPGRNNVAVHWDGYGENHKQWGTSNVYFGPTADGFNTFGMLWEPTKVSWYIDGKKTAEFANDRIGSIPAYFLINVQMGSWATKDVDLSKLPDDYLIDYVRVWQLKDRLK